MEEVDLSWLNCLLVDRQLNDLESCVILVLWLTNCHVVVILFISLHSQIEEIFYRNTAIQKLNSNCERKRDTT